MGSDQLRSDIGFYCRAQDEVLGKHREIKDLIICVSLSLETNPPFHGYQYKYYFNMENWLYKMNGQKPKL
jgi:hypothetical protein